MVSGRQIIAVGRTRRTGDGGIPRWVRIAALIGLLVGLLALAGCGRAVTAHSGASATAGARQASAPDSTITQGPQLSWRPITMPSTWEGQPPVVAGSDGDVAYSCAIAHPGGDGAVRILLTRDRGQHWAAGGTIAGLAGANTCWLAVDDNNPNVVVTTLNTASRGASPGPSTGAAYGSFDGGGTWRALGAHLAIGHVASYHGTYYAARQYQATIDSPMVGSLSVSSDQMATWQAIGPDQSFAQAWFWLSPLTGSLLATSGSGDQNSLVRSDDGGAHWTPVHVPTWAQTILAAPQPNGSPWLMCVAAAAGPGSGSGTIPTNLLACSADGGQTWTTRPGLNLTNRSPKGFTYAAPAFAFALAGDGAVLATLSNSTAVTQLYRLPAGASAWQALGALSGIASCDYATGPGAGVLWQRSMDAPNPYATASYPSE